MVLQNCGPQGYPGMAEVGNMPLPKKLLAQGEPRPPVPAHDVPITHATATTQG